MIKQMEDFTLIMIRNTRSVSDKIWEQMRTSFTKEENTD